MPQTVDAVRGAWSATAGAVIGRISPQSYDRRMVLAAITGPDNSTLSIYRGHVITDHARVSRVYPADSRTYDASMDQAPIIIYAGEAVTLAWTGGASGPGATASATITSQWGRDAVV